MPGIMWTKALRPIIIGIICVVLGLFWWSQISPVISDILPWLPQGFNIPIIPGVFSFTITIDFILIAFGVILIGIGIIILIIM